MVNQIIQTHSVIFFFPSKGTSGSNTNNERLERLPDTSVFNEAHKCCSMVLNEVNDPGVTAVSHLTPPCAKGKMCEPIKTRHLLRNRLSKASLNFLVQGH